MPTTVEMVAPNLVRLSIGPVADAVNMYLIGDVLVDSGMSWQGRKLAHALAGRSVAAHAITHAHFDHCGSSRYIAGELGIPVWCGAGDREAIETGDPISVLPKPRGPALRFARWLTGEGQPVSGVLSDGDELGGFTVIETPGHTPGHLAFWREADRALVLGDVLFHRNPVTLRRGLAEPFSTFTWNVSTNRASARKLADLGPELICFGHGAPLRDPRPLRRFVAALPQ